MSDRRRILGHHWTGCHSWAHVPVVLLLAWLVFAVVLPSYQLPHLQTPHDVGSGQSHGRFVSQATAELSCAPPEGRQDEVIPGIKVLYGISSLEVLPSSFEADFCCHNRPPPPTA